jgi:PAS domain S-box-containing protein
MSNAALPVHYDPALVFLSVAIAVFASFTALDLTGRIKVAQGRSRAFWLACAAVAMGGGIWSMHFVAMLAFSIDVPITYDVVTTLASLAVAIVVTGVGLYIVARGRARWGNLLPAGILMGVGVASMHYTGMAAIRCGARISYDPTLFALSIVIALVAATAALWLAFTLQTAWQKTAAAFAMGAAIAGMHYTGMAAASFQPDTTLILVADPTVSDPWLASGVSVLTFMVLGFALFSSVVDRRFTVQIEREAIVLKRSEQRLTALLQNSSDIIAVLDPAGTVVFESGSAGRILGYGPNGLVGRPLGAVATEGAASTLERFLETLAHQPDETVSTELRLRHVRGEAREFEAIGINRLSDPAVGGHVVTFHDITERNVTERQLRATSLRAEAASRAKSEFLANMSHELRTPLNAILGFSEILTQGLFGPLGDPRYHDYAEDIHRSGTHLLTVISGILDLSKAEAGHLELHESIIHLPDAMDASLATVRAQAERAGVALVVAAPGNLPQLLVDEGKLRQILINLLSNAIKFTPEGGRVSLEAGLDAAGGIAIHVRDTGIGMAPEEIPLALQPFQQIDSRLSRRYEGTGLGLPLSKRLAELHGAGLEIDSTPGRGTRVTVRIPPERVQASWNRGGAAAIA